MFWGLIFSWETARKIRAPEDEDDYVTYSRILGTRRAPWVPMAGLTVSFGIALWLGHTLGLSPLFSGVTAIAWAYAMSGFARFLRDQNTKTAKLRPYVEAASLALYVAFLVALPATFHAAWAGPF